MTLRYWLFLALVVLGSAASAVIVPGAKVASPEARAVVLVPQTLGGRPVKERWVNVQRGGVVEDGALFAGVAGAPEVQLDFYRNRASRHNGALCYMMKGESVVWDRPQVLPTRDGSSQFDVVLLWGSSQLRVIAATECTPEGCAETDIAGKGARLRLQDRGVNVVPVSVALTRPVGAEDDLDAVGDQLLRDLKAALQETDLAPARQLASLQTRR